MVSHAGGLREGGVQILERRALSACQACVQPPNPPCPLLHPLAPSRDQGLLCILRPRLSSFTHQTSEKWPLTAKSGASKEPARWGQPESWSGRLPGQRVAGSGGQWRARVRNPGRAGAGPSLASDVGRLKCGRTLSRNYHETSDCGSMQAMPSSSIRWPNASQAYAEPNEQLPKRLRGVGSHMAAISRRLPGAWVPQRSAARGSAGDTGRGPNRRLQSMTSNHGTEYTVLLAAHIVPSLALAEYSRSTGPDLDRQTGN